MAYDDTKWGGFAKIIVDTSTMSVGDKVRVKSMTTNTNYDKTVATVGTPLIWETDIFKDYVKICMVQTINDTPTEIGGVYRECDYGQTLFINVLDKTTLGGIQGILNAHQGSDLLAIGDEVGVTINGILETYVLLKVTPTEASFGWKYVSESAYAMSPIDYSYRTSVHDYCDNIYSLMAEKDKQYIKEKTVHYQFGTDTRTATRKIWIPTRGEVFGDSSYEPSAGVSQFPIFATQVGRQKTSKSGTSYDWQTASSVDAGTSVIYVLPTGLENNASSNSHILPCFMLTADS